MAHISKDLLTETRNTIRAFIEATEDRPQMKTLEDLLKALEQISTEDLASDPQTAIKEQHFVQCYIADLELSLLQRNAWLASRRMALWLEMLAGVDGDEKKIAGDAKAREAKLDEICNRDEHYSEMESLRRTETWQMVQTQATVKAYDWILRLATKI